MSTTFLLNWLAVSAVMSVLIVIAALAVQQLSARAVPARIIWACAMIALIAVVATQPLRRAPASLPRDASSTPLTLSTVPGVALSPAQQLAAMVRRAPEAGLERITAAATTLARTLPAPARLWLLLAWPFTTAGIALVLFASYRRQRAMLQRATRHAIAGAIVHVSEDTGPAVIGAAEPAIVVPQWLLERSDEEQRLVVAHEAAHIAAGDPWLLLAGCAAVALMPWNPAAWFVLARLRLAIELDCDARVLARGTNTRQYGQLLIELSAAAPAPAIPLGAPAFSYRASHLERRLRTMTARPARFLAARRVAALVTGSAALLAACGAELPTAAELQGMDVAKAEARIGKAVRLDSSNTVYLVNGTKVTADRAYSIKADSIVTINVRKANPKQNEVFIVTRDGSAARSGVRTVTGVAIKPTAKDSSAQPMFLIDGVKATKADMDRLSPSAIESVEVIKGVAATTSYGADGVNGVIKITTKK
jgi:beta-lactamase regulating signal transducer with metallopeptidase domain